MGIQIDPPGPVDSVGAVASSAVTGSVTGPAAGGQIATITPTVAGVYQVTVNSIVTGTATSAELNNLKVTVNGATVAQIVQDPATDVGNGIQTMSLNVAWTTGAIVVAAVAAAGAAAVYSAQLIVTRIG